MPRGPIPVLALVAPWRLMNFGRGWVSEPAAGEHGAGSHRGGIMAEAKEAKKVIVLGIDGGHPELIQRFVKEGKLPNFEKLMKR